MGMYLVVTDYDTKEEVGKWSNLFSYSGDKDFINFLTDYELHIKNNHCYETTYFRPKNINIVIEDFKKSSLSCNKEIFIELLVDLKFNYSWYLSYD